MAKKRTQILVFVRHAHALDRDVAKESGMKDSLRPITTTGRQKFKKVLSSIHQTKLALRLRDLEVVFASPFLRAQQTAELLVKFFEIDRIKNLSGVTPYANPKTLMRTLVSLNGLNPKLREHRHPKISENPTQTKKIPISLKVSKDLYASQNLIVIVSHEPFISRFIKEAANMKEASTNTSAAQSRNPNPSKRVPKIKKGSFTIVKYQIKNKQLVLKSFRLVT